MKVSKVQLTFRSKELRLATGMARLRKLDDDTITTEDQAKAYMGPEFLEGVTCQDLHVVTEHGLVKVNFMEDGKRRSYFYPVDQLGRVATES